MTTLLIKDESVTKVVDNRLYHALIRGDVPRIQRVLDEGADPNAVCGFTEKRVMNKERLRPLGLAIVNRQEPYTGCNIAAMKVLLNAGADPNLLADDFDDEYENLLELASQQPLKADDAVILLLDAGANPNYHISGRTPLYMIMAYGTAKGFRALLKAGAHIDVAPDGKELGRTMAHSAILRSSEPEQLLCAMHDYGFDIHRPDADGRTPIQFAEHIESPINRKIIPGGNASADTNIAAEAK